MNMISGENAIKAFEKLVKFNPKNEKLSGDLQRIITQADFQRKKILGKIKSSDFDQRKVGESLQVLAREFSINGDQESLEKIRDNCYQMAKKFMISKRIRNNNDVIDTSKGEHKVTIWIHSFAKEIEKILMEKDPKRQIWSEYYKLVP